MASRALNGASMRALPKAVTIDLIVGSFAHMEAKSQGQKEHGI
jgi:hypothetical protein